ncbi:MAG: flagellar type III secretion system pore protein FliP [Defluviitaleaceae bacterium]|nr:flagellar type III secretion system pore protein FliP [Defluviitaleaceae bacterium]
MFVVFFSYETVSATSLQDLIDQNIINPDLIDMSNFGNFFTGDTEDAVIGINIGGESVVASSTVQVIFLFTLLALAPTLLIMITSFTRTIIVMHFLRSALGTQQMPPNQVLIGLALFITFFIMSPVFNRVQNEALIPYSLGEITQAEVIEYGMEPFREFMTINVSPDNVALFSSLSGMDVELNEGDLPYIPFRVLIPAFILTELTAGFVFGFILFIPFIVIDMVVSSILMAMGMMMLPPAMISTPFKILLFIMVDGWSLVIDILVRTFYMIS